MPLSLMHRQHIPSVWTVIFFILLLAVAGIARAATYGVTVPGQQTLTNKYLPYATSGTQLGGNSPAWRDSAHVLGITNWKEGTETITDAAAVNLDFATQRTKVITLNQNTVFTPINIPAAATETAQMAVEITGNGVSTVTFNAVTFQTPQVVVPPAGVKTFYILRARSGTVQGYCGEAALPCSALNYGVVMDGLTDDSGAIQAALNANTYVCLPPGTYLITNPILLADNRRLSGDSEGGTIFNVVGDFRCLAANGVATNTVDNVVIENITFNCSGGGANQTPVSFSRTSNCQLKNVVINTPALDGVEVLESSYMTARNIRIISPGAFGYFVYDSTDCMDEDVYVYRPTVWGHEFKNCKRCVSRRIRVIEPQTYYGIYIWTGFNGTTLPGNKLSEYCGYIDPYVLGGAASKTLMLIDASPNCFLINPVCDQVSGGWTPIQVSGTSFYNEQSAMTGDTSVGSTNVLNVTNVGQLSGGQRIHIGSLNAAMITNNFTIHGIVGTTVQLTSAATETLTGAAIGWVSSSQGAYIQNPQVNCAPGSLLQGIAVSGYSTDDPLHDVTITGGRVKDAGTHALYAHEARNLKVSKLMLTNSLSDTLYVDASTVTLDSVTMSNPSTVTNSALFLTGGSEAVASNCRIDGYKIVGLYTYTNTDRVTWTGGSISNCFTAAAILNGKSILTGANISNSRIDAGSFGGQVRIYGSSNLVSGCIFEPGSSTWLDSHIKEESGASGNLYLGNLYGGGAGFNTDVIFDTSTSAPYDLILAANRAKIFTGLASPETVVYGQPGDLYLKTDPPGTLYIKRTGLLTATGWSPSLDGVGAANYLPIWSDPDTLGNSLLYQADVYGVQLLAQTADNLGAYYELLKRGTTGDTNSNIASNSIIGEIRWRGWNGTNYSSTTAAISVRAAQDFTPSGSGSRMLFETTDIGEVVRETTLELTSDHKVKIPALATNNYLGIDGDNNLVVTNAPAASSTATSFQAVGSGTDHIYGSNAYEKIVFGTSGPSFTLTNAGTYQIMLSVSANSSETFRQRFWLTNVTDTAYVTGSAHEVIVSSGESVLPLILQLTTSGSNRLIDLYGQCDNATPANANVSSTNTVLNVIRLY